jgi:hypothetical protein
MCAVTNLENKRSRGDPGATSPLPPTTVLPVPLYPRCCRRRPFHGRRRRREVFLLPQIQILPENLPPNGPTS